MVSTSKCDTKLYWMAKPQTYVIAALDDTRSTEWSKRSFLCMQSFLRGAPEIAAAVRATKKHQTYLLSVGKCHFVSRCSPEDIFTLTICTPVCHWLSIDREAWTLSLPFPHAVLAWGTPAHSWRSDVTAEHPEMDALNIQTYFLYQMVKAGTKHSKNGQTVKLPFFVRCLHQTLSIYPEF